MPDHFLPLSSDQWPPPQAPTNSPGATLFYLYIVSALVFSSLIVSSLTQAYRKLTVSSSATERLAAISTQTSRHLAIFAVLAGGSFVVLSFNMLWVLVWSYGMYWEGFSSFSSSSSRYRDLVGGAGLRETLVGVLGRVWEWSTRSELFYDFAVGIFRGRGGAAAMGGLGGEGQREEEVVRFWTHAALVGTWVVGLVVALERGEGGFEEKGGQGMAGDAARGTGGRGGDVDGRQGDGEKSKVDGVRKKSRDIRRKWMFHLLAQILPPSFTLNLFFIALLLQRARNRTTTTTQTVRKTTKPTASYLNNLTTPSSLLAHTSFTLYIYLLSIAPQRATHGTNTQLLALVLAARILLLLVGLALGYIAQREKISTASIILPAALYGTISILLNLWTLRSTFLVGVEDLVNALLFNHPAVSALGCDFIICLLSFGAWVGLGLHDSTKI